MSAPDPTVSERDVRIVRDALGYVLAAARMAPDGPAGDEHVRAQLALGRIADALARLTEENGCYREALALAEWEGGLVNDIGGDRSRSCPVCGFAETTGHANTCEIRRALHSGPRSGSET